MRVAAVAGSTKLTCVELASPDRLASGRALGEVAVGVPPPMPQMLVGTGRASGSGRRRAVALHRGLPVRWAIARHERTAHQGPSPTGQEQVPSAPPGPIGDLWAHVPNAHPCHGGSRWLTGQRLVAGTAASGVQLMTLWLIRLFQLDEGRRSSPSFDVAQATAAARIEQ